LDQLGKEERRGEGGLDHVGEVAPDTGPSGWTLEEPERRGEGSDQVVAHELEEEACEE